MDSSNKVEYVFLDPQKCDLLSLSSVGLVKAELKNPKKNCKIISTLDSSRILNLSIEIDKDTPEDLIGDAINEAVYEDASIDPEIEYIQKHIKKGRNYDGSKIEYDVFLINKNEIYGSFSECAKTYPYIDYVIPEIFLFRSLYEYGELKKEGYDIFVHFGEKSAFLTLYQKGNLIFHKTFDLNLDSLKNVFNEYSPAVVTPEEFKNIFSGNLSESIYEGALNKLNNEIFIVLDEVMSYIKRMYSFSVVENFFLDSAYGINEKLYLYLEELLGYKAKRFEFNSENTRHIEQIALKALAHELPCLNESNFTVYARPKPFFSRPVGKTALYLIIAAVLSLLYGVFIGVMYYMTSESIKTLTLDKNKIALQAQNIQNTINTFKAEAQSATTKENEAKAELQSSLNILEEVRKVKEGYKQKTPMIIYLSKEITRTGTNLQTLQIEDTGEKTKITAGITATNDKSLSTLIDTLGRNTQYTLEIDTITRGENDYNTTLRLIRR